MHMILKKHAQISGFSLVELIVSVAITAVIMVGLSAFFSSGFQQLLHVQEESEAQLEQLVTHSILRRALGNASQVFQMENDHIIVQKKNTQTPLNFAFLGEKNETLVIKDLIIFNGRYFALSSHEAVKNIDQPAGLASHKGSYYVAAPLENAIYRCGNLPGNCADKLDIPGLKEPIDVVSDGNFLYVTDAGNGRIIQIANPGNGNQVTVLAENLNYPTGLAYYQDIEPVLFFSETGGHQVKKISLSDQSIEVMVGAGEQKECDKTAYFCQLRYPTGLTIEKNPAGDHLYIADTGNGRLLKVSDPGIVDSFTLEVESPDQDIDAHSIRVIFPIGVSAKNASVDLPNALPEEGEQKINENVWRYAFKAEIINDTVDTNGCEEPCVPSKNKIEIDKPDLFKVGDTLQVGEGAGADDNNDFTITSKNGDILTLSKPLDEHHDAGTLVNLIKTIGKNTALTFEFENVKTTGIEGGYKIVDVQFLDSKGLVLGTHRLYFKLGDGKIRGIEEEISVIGNSEFPTGISWSGGNLKASQSPLISNDFKQWDYQSKDPIQNLNFELKNNDRLLEIFFETTKEEGGEINPTPYRFRTPFNPQ